jgi:hypothetical protein
LAAIRNSLYPSEKRTDACFCDPAKAKEYLLLSSDFFSFGALNFGGLLFKEKVDGFKIIELAAR